MQAAALGSSLVNVTDVTDPLSLIAALRAVQQSGLFANYRSTADSFTLSRSLTLPAKTHSQTYLNKDAAPAEFKMDHTVVCVGHCHIDTAWLWYVEKKNMQNSKNAPLRTL